MIHAVVQGDEKARAVCINMPTQLVHGLAHGIGRTGLRRVEGLALYARNG